MLVAQQLQRGNLFDIVDRVLLNTELDPLSLELELTESSLWKIKRNSTHYFREFALSRHKKSLWMIFGTGYSSLSYLRDFP